MRRTIPGALAVSLFVGATPVLAQDDVATTEVDMLQRAEVPALGLAMSFPETWSVSMPQGERVSTVTDAQGEPVMETTALHADGGDGTWCDIDAYLDMTADSGLEGFAYALVTDLQQDGGADAAMIVAEEELPTAGPAYRIEIFDQDTGHIRGLYLFDGPVREDGTFERYLLSCAAREVTEPFWTGIAQSAAFLEPDPADEEPTEDDEASLGDGLQEGSDEPAEED